MAILSKVCKPDNFESHNSLKLSFTNIRGLRSNFVDCESFLESNSPDILALCETNLDDSIDSGNFSVRGYLPLIRKDSSTHMHGLAVYVKEGLPFARDLSLENSADSYLCFRLALLHSVSYFFFLYRSPSSSLCTVFDSVSSNIDEVLSVNPSANVFVFGDFNVHHKDWLTYSGGTDRPGELCYNFSISSDLTQIVNFPTRIPDCDSHSPALLDLFLSSDASICSTMAFPPLGNSDHVVVSVSIDFPVNSKQDAPFHRVAYDYSRADWDGLRDHLRDVPWEDIFKLGASTAASEFCEWVQVGIDVYIPHRKYQVKSHSSPWFSAACAAAIVHRNHFFRLYQQNKSSESKVKFRQASNRCKRVLETAKLAYATKTKESITSQKLGSRDFWRIAKTASKKIGALIRSMKFLSPEVALYLYKSTIRPCMEYCCHVWAGAPSCYLELLDKLQKRICRTVGPSLAASLEPLAHRRNVASLSLFYRYYFGRCSSELAQLVPLPYSRGRSTRYSDRLHDFSVTIPRCYKDVYVNSLFPRTARLWNSLPIECFPLTYDLSGFKSRINRYLLTVGSF